MPDEHSLDSLDPQVTQQMLQRLLKADLASFVRKSFHTVSPGQLYEHNWHIEAITWALERCYSGETKRLLITLPPRNLKSICASVAFPAWVLGKDPGHRIICASYANELTAKHARDFRSVVASDWYRDLFPRCRARKDTELEFVTSKEGYRFGTSVGGTLTGRGGSLIIIDDPLKPEEAMSKAARDHVRQWYDGTLYSRLDSKKDDVIVLIMQRLHLDDLAGHVLEKENWEHLNLPAIAQGSERIQIGPKRFHHRAAGDLLHPLREPERVLQEAKINLGSFFYEAQYQQTPVPEGGNLVKWDWFQFYDELPKPSPKARIIQSWDTASKAGELNDYSVCTTWLAEEADFYLIDVVRAQLDYPNLKRKVIETKATHRANSVLIEDKGSGTSLIQDLRREADVRPIAVTPEGDKITRMSAQSAKIEAGQVHLPATAPWLGDFKTELNAFPNGRHDDQVDSLSQFLSWIDRSRSRRVRVGHMFYGTSCAH